MFSPVSSRDSCLICLESNVEKLRVFKTQDELEDIQNKISVCIHNFCLPVEIAETSLVSLSVCNSCDDSLNGVLSLVQCSAQVHEEWDEVYIQDKNSLMETCRLCAKTSTEVLRIFGTDGRRLDLDEKINMCIYPLKVTKGDKLPLNICSQCLDVVLMGAELHSKYQETERKRQIKTCPICFKTFANEGALKRHKCPFCKVPEAAKKEEEMTICDQCGDFIKASELDKHVCSTVFCKNCDDTFTSKLDLKHHYKNIHNRFSCGSPKCFKVFDSKVLRREHSITVHQNRGLIRTICDLCGVEVVKYKLREHIYYVHEKKQNKYNCELCHKSYKTRSLILDHIKRHLNIRNFKCLQCTSKFFCRTHLNRHVECMHSNQVLNCSKCSKKFHNVLNLKIHIEGVHENTWNFHCSICDVGYKTLKDVTSHFQTHTKIEKSKIENKFYKTSEYQCEICFCYLQNRMKFAWHLRQKHNCNQKEYNQMDIKTKEKINKEGNLINKVTFKCNICFKVCNSRSGLNAHIKTHNKNKDFVCKFCNKSFSSALQLSSHRIAHDKDVTCDFCQDKFSTKAKLRKHIIDMHINYSVQ